MLLTTLDVAAAFQDSVTLEEPRSPGSLHRTLEIYNLPIELLARVLDFALPPNAFPNADANVPKTPDVRDSYDEGIRYATLSALYHTSKVLRETLKPMRFLDPSFPRKADNHTREVCSAFLLIMEEWEIFSVPTPALIRKGPVPKYNSELQRKIRADELTPKSRHTCLECVNLVPSASLPGAHISSTKGKFRDRPDPPSKWNLAQMLKDKDKRYCVSCLASNERAGFMASSRQTIRWISGWEDEARGTGTAVMRHGFFCSRMKCGRFAKADDGQSEAEFRVSTGYMKKQCGKCLEYRKEEREARPGRGHVMS